MDKEEQLQKLLRLKRHEQPPEGFAEEFLEKFQRRQRTELVRRSALSILWERSQAWLEGLRRPVVIWSAGAAYAAILLCLWLLPLPAPHTGDMMMFVGTEQTNAPAVGFKPNAPKGSIPIQSPTGIPGKNRTPAQPQEKESVIGPEVKPQSYNGQEGKPEGYQPPPLREL